MPAIHDVGIELLLAAMTSTVGEDGMMSVLPVDGSARIGGIYATVFYSHRGLVETALHVRSQGAPYLRALSIEAICDMLREFMAENYATISRETLFQQLVGPFSDQVPTSVKRELARALAQSKLFAPTDRTTLFPILTIEVDADFSCPAFFLCAPASLPRQVPENLRQRLSPDLFPPIEGNRFRSESPTSWLGVNSPNLESSQKMMRTILGSAALTPTHTYRHMFSGRNMWGGHLTLGGEYSMSFGDAATPRLMENIHITAADHAWLNVLSSKLGSADLAIRREMTSLEYYYRAWGLSPSERFPVLCMAIDAIYSEVGNSTAAVRGGIQATIGPLNERRLRDLMQIRHSVIHGEAPDVFDSSKYDEYYRIYGDDPIADLGVVVAACLRKKVFAGALREHAEPHLDVIARGQAAGRLPRVRPKYSILDSA